MKEEEDPEDSRKGNLVKAEAGTETRISRIKGDPSIKKEAKATTENIKIV